jgi:hypothetical protein
MNGALDYWITAFIANAVLGFLSYEILASENTPKNEPSDKDLETPALMHKNTIRRICLCIA